MRFKAVLFDCDGVLVNSEPISKRLLLSEAARAGVQMDEADLLTRFYGRRMAECLDDIRSTTGQALPDDFYERFREREYAALTAEVTVIPGVEQLLDFLDSNTSSYRYGVASNGPQEKMQATLGATGLLPRFGQHVYSAYDINDFKPAPGVYLHAAQQLGVAPHECLVVEDSIVGSSAGIAAGMAVAVYTQTTAAANFPDAVFAFVDSLADVVEILGG